MAHSISKKCTYTQKVQLIPSISYRKVSKIGFKMLSSTFHKQIKIISLPMTVMTNTCRIFQKPFDNIP